jgi:hypothetical protein
MANPRGAVVTADEQEFGDSAIVRAFSIAKRRLETGTFNPLVFGINPRLRALARYEANPGTPNAVAREVKEHVELFLANDAAFVLTLADVYIKDNRKRSGEALLIRTYFPSGRMMEGLQRYTRNPLTFDGTQRGVSNDADWSKHR